MIVVRVYGDRKYLMAQLLELSRCLINVKSFSPFLPSNVVLQ